MRDRSNGRGQPFVRPTHIPAPRQSRTAAAHQQSGRSIHNVASVVVFAILNNTVALTGVFYGGRGNESILIEKDLRKRQRHE